MTLIQGEEGFIIGGYTTKNWNISENWYKDENSFLFNLTDLKMFPIKKGYDSIRCSKENGPWFAFIGFKRTNRDLTQGAFHYKNKEQAAFENYNEIIPNNNCNRTFNVKEVEIYNIN